MKIEEALKETGKVVHEADVFDGCYVELNNDGQLVCKHGKKCPQHSWTTPTLQQIIEDAWSPYHEVKEIRPEKAGELWEKEGYGNLFIYKKIRGESLHYVFDDGSNDPVGIDIIHGENGYTRISPKVEDDSIKTKQCPECGCDEYTNKDQLAEGYRVCKECEQEWYTDVDYAKNISIGRIEIKGVVCKEEEECVYTVSTTFTAPQDLANKPMKMILEYSKV